MDELLGPLSALTDATRARILLILDAHELTVAELQAVLQLPQSTVSRHLKLLSDDGWLVNRSEGASRYYRVARQVPGALQRVWDAVRDEIASSPDAARDGVRAREVLGRRRTRSQEFFSTAAAQWDAVRSELFGEAPEGGALLALLDGSWEVADLGCGTGQVTAVLAPWVRQVTAVDDSEAMLAAARSRLAGFGNVELRRGELEAVPLPARSVDVALLFLVLHYVPDVSAVLSEAARVLRPGGRVLIVDMDAHGRAEYREQMGHVWLGFERDQMGGWLSDAGFEQVKFGRVATGTTARGPSLFAAVGVKTIEEMT
ncbi:MAG TPA: metalloregulator ArsR/SmtB family transcription factor [Longimicrobiales bacterium]